MIREAQNISSGNGSGCGTSVADPGCLSRIRIFSIPDPNCLHLGSLILITPKNLSILTPKKAKKWFLSCKKYDPGCSSRIPDPDAGFLPIPDSGSRIQGSKRHPIPDPGSGSAILHKYRKRLRIFIF
jgi:hypothetical protein